MLDKPYKFGLNETKEAHPLAMHVKFTKHPELPNTELHELRNHLAHFSYLITAVNTTMNIDPYTCTATDVVYYRGPHWHPPLLGPAIMGISQHAGILAGETEDGFLTLTAEIMRTPTSHPKGTIYSTAEVVLALKVYRPKSAGISILQISKLHKLLRMGDGSRPTQIIALYFPYEIYKTKQDILQSEHTRAPSLHLTTLCPNVIELVTNPGTPSIKLIVASMIADNLDHLMEVVPSLTTQADARPLQADATLPTHWNKTVTLVVLNTRYNEHKRILTSEFGHMGRLQLSLAGTSTHLTPLDPTKYREAWKLYNTQLSQRIKNNPHFGKLIPPWKMKASAPPLDHYPNSTLVVTHHTANQQTGSWVDRVSKGPTIDFKQIIGTITADVTENVKQALALQLTPVYGTLQSHDESLEELQNRAARQQIEIEDAKARADAAEMREAAAREELLQMQEAITMSQVTEAELRVDIKNLQVNTLTPDAFRVMQDEGYNKYRQERAEEMAMIKAMLGQRTQEDTFRAPRVQHQQKRHKGTDQAETEGVEEATEEKETETHAHMDMDDNTIGTTNDSDN